MNVIDTTLNNYSLWPLLSDILTEFPHDYMIDENGVIRRNPSPLCPLCDITMNRNGYNIYTKANLGSIRMGRWECPSCGCSLEEDRTFWENLKDAVFKGLSRLICLLRKHRVSYEGSSEILSLLFPRSKETVRGMFKEAIEDIGIPDSEGVYVIHYDEQHPKEGRAQKFRLTLLNGKDGSVIADELFDDKSPGTILAFFRKHLDPNQPTFIVTDLHSSYPPIFEEFFKGGYHHQLCLLHSNKLICKDFKKMKTLKELRLRYEFLNIFYDRSKELKYLDNLIRKESKKKGKPGYKKWLRNSRKKFFEYVHKLENRRRRKKETLKVRPYNGAVQMFNRLADRYYELPEVAQKRLHMIDQKWDNLTAFHEIEGAPATNNAIENYYSATLKTDRKKQFRTDLGIVDQLKLSRLVRAGSLTYKGPSLIQLFMRFIPFQDPG